MRTSFSSLLLALIGAVSIGACSKTPKAEGGEKTTPVQNEAAAKSGKASPDLEAAIAAPGAKTVTAHGADGKTVVLQAKGNLLAETDTYQIKADLPGDAKSGGESAVMVHVIPKTGWKINQDFPTKLTIHAPEGISLKADSIGPKGAEKFGEKGATFKVAFDCEAAGSKDFKADFRFAVCTDATCDPKNAKLAWSVAVQ